MFIAFLILNFFSSAHPQTLHSRWVPSLHFGDSLEPLPMLFPRHGVPFLFMPNRPNLAILWAQLRYQHLFLEDLPDSSPPEFISSSHMLWRLLLDMFPSSYSMCHCHRPAWWRVFLLSREQRQFHHLPQHPLGCGVCCVSPKTHILFTLSHLWTKKLSYIGECIII